MVSDEDSLLREKKNACKHSEIRNYFINFYWQVPPISRKASADII